MNRTVTMQQPKSAAALNIRTITMTALLSAMAYGQATGGYENTDRASSDLSPLREAFDHEPAQR